MATNTILLRLIPVFPKDFANATSILNITKRMNIHEYIEVERICQGINGVSRKVRNTKTNELFLIKEISSLEDINDIIKIVDGIQTLLAIKNQNILKCCGYDYVEKYEFNKFSYTFYVYFENYDQNFLEKNAVLFTYDHNFLKELINSILSALLYLHKKGIIHGELTLENIMMVNNVFKIGFLNDVFILNKSADAISGKDKPIKKSTRYISPELIKFMLFPSDSIEIDLFKCDIFSLGLSFLEIALMKDTTGLNSRLNYEFLEKINEIIDQVVIKYDDKELGVLLSRMLIIEPKERPNMFDLIEKKENYPGYMKKIIETNKKYSISNADGLIESKKILNISDKLITMQINNRSPSTVSFFFEVPRLFF